MKSNIKVIYPGRFQPFGPHHYKVYEWLCTKFDPEDIFISTSNKVDDKSPLNFEEKRSIINKYGIDNVICCQQPYKSQEILNQFDPDNTSVIFIYGEKDEGRISYVKKDGSPAYFQKYLGQHVLEPLSKNGYIIVAPHISLSYEGLSINSTLLREILPSLTQVKFKGLMGWYDPVIHRLFQKKFRIVEQPNNKTMVISNQGKYRKHIFHPYEDTSLSFNELIEFIRDVCHGNLEASIKLDGQNLQTTFKDGEWKSARNKTTVKSPMTYQELSDFFNDRGDIQFVFTQAHEDISTIMQNIPKEIFNNGLTFINYEILHPKTKNVFEYGEPTLSIHGLIHYDLDGNEISRSSDYSFDVHNHGYEFNYMRSPKHQLKPLADLNLISVFEFEINKIRLDSRLNWNSKLKEIPTDKLKYELQLLILFVGNAVIQNLCQPYSQLDIKNINSIISRIEKNIESLENYNDDKLRIKFNHEMSRLNLLGGYKSINPIEGLVIEWKNKQMKLVGSFAPVNQILGLFHYRR